MSRLVIILGFATVLAASPAAAQQLLEGDNLEAFTGIPAREAQPLGLAELAELRGGSLEFLFSVTFAAAFDMAGNAEGALTVNAAFGDESGQIALDGDSATPPSGVGAGPGTISVNIANPDVLASAGVGTAFSGAQGIFQISQVPGSGNDVRQALVINLAIIQTSDADLGALRDQLLPLFGL